MTRTSALRRAAAIVGSADAADMVHAALLDMLIRRDNLRVATSGYLVTATVNHALKFATRRQRRVVLVDADVLVRLEEHEMHLERGGRAYVPNTDA